MKDRDTEKVISQKELLGEINSFLKEERKKSEINLQSPKRPIRLVRKIGEIASNFYLGSLAVSFIGLGIVSNHELGWPGLIVGTSLTTLGLISIGFKISSDM
ncbi:MAG: hypothetical protein WCV81_05090 [Microgenomates group bacterium]|jgi:hypothetical protein